MSAVFRRSGRVESQKTSNLIRSGNRAKSANDSVEQFSTRVISQSPKRGYVTRSRVAAVASQLNERHCALLHDVHRLGAATGQQLQRLHYQRSEAGRRLARKELNQLARWQVVSRLERPIGGVRAGSSGRVYALGPTGQRLLHPEKRRYRAPWTPQPSYLRHALGVSELYVCLREAERTGAMTLVTFDAEPTCWRPYVGPGGTRLTLKPDALIVMQLDDYEDRYFIEVDCGTEPGPRLTAKARIYIRYWQTGREQANTNVFPYVMWVVPNERRAAFLIDTLASLPPEYWQLFLVATSEEAIKRIAIGTNVPISNRKEVNS